MLERLEMTGGQVNDVDVVSVPRTVGRLCSTGLGMVRNMSHDPTLLYQLFYIRTKIRPPLQDFPKKTPVSKIEKKIDNNNR